MKIICILMCVCIGGCVDTVHQFSNPDVSEKQFRIDKANCINYAETNNWGYANNIAGVNRWISLYENCMISKGYIAEPEQQ
jgi:hypothetical protein